MAAGRMSRLIHVHSSANDASSPELPSEQKVNWVILLIFIVLGLVALFGGWLVAYEVTPLRNEHAAYWSGLLANVGTTLLLAAALVWFERVLLRRVRTENVRAVKEAADQAADAAAERIAPRIEELERAVQADTSARASERTRSAELVATTPDFESIEGALGQAAAINAVRGRTFSSSSETLASIVVPGGGTPESPRITVVRVPRAESRPARLVLMHSGDDVVWDEEAGAREVFAALKDAMIAAGHGAEAGELSATSFFANCSSLLRDAIAARQHDQDAWLSGSPAVELINTDWVVTEAGIEVRGHGIVAERELFGHYAMGTNRRVGDKVPSDPPHGLERSLWEVACRRASASLLGLPFPSLYAQQPPPRWLA